jgi:O-antigen ligase
MKYINISDQTRDNLIRLVLILAVVALSMYLPLSMSRSRILQILVLVIGALGGLFLLKNPYPGFLLLIVGSILIPFDIGTGTSSAINPAIVLIAGLTVLWLFDMLILNQKFSFLPSRALIPSFLLAISVLFSFGIGQLPWFPIPGATINSQIGGMAIFLLSVALIFVAAHQIKSLVWLERLTWVFVFSAAYYLFFSHVIPAVAPSLTPMTRNMFSQGMSGSLFWVWTFAIAFSQALCNNRLKWYNRMLLFTIVAVAFYFRMIVTREWSSGWVPAVVAVIVIVLIHFRWAGVGLAVIGSFSLIIYGTMFSNLLLRNNEYSYSTRLEAWEIALDIIKSSPIFGFGPANYHFYTTLFPIRGYFVQFNSHNNYIDLLLQVGIVGTLIFLWLMYEVWQTGWKIRFTVPSGFSYAYVIGCLGGLVGTAAAGMFGDWVIPFVYNVGLHGFRASMLSFLFFGGLIALENIVRTNRNELAEGITHAAG